MSKDRTSHSFPLPDVDSAEVLSALAEARLRLRFFSGPTCLASQRASRFFGARARLERGQAARTRPPRRGFCLARLAAATGVASTADGERGSAVAELAPRPAVPAIRATRRMATRRMGDFLPHVGQKDPPASRQDQFGAGTIRMYGLGSSQPSG